MKFHNILLLTSILLLCGCVQQECSADSDCVQKTCTNVICSSGKCVYSNITDCCGNGLCEVNETYNNCPADCPNCDDFNECTEDIYDYHEQRCINNPIIPCCGNDLCEVSENYTTCVADCPNCDDFNECTNDYFNYTTQVCVNEPLIPCCGNGKCEEGESHSSCISDCPFGDDEYIKLGVSFLNSTTTGRRYWYVLQNCLAENITTLRVRGYWNGEMEGEVTKSWLEQWSSPSEQTFLHAPPSTCISPASLIVEAWVDKTPGEEYNVSVYYKFEYNNKTIEFTSNESTCVIVADSLVATPEDFAFFTINNTNIKIT